jgi:hypothetical protein
MALRRERAHLPTDDLQPVLWQRPGGVVIDQHLSVQALVLPARPGTRTSGRPRR